MIHRQVATAADALMETYRVAEVSGQLQNLLPDVLPLLATALVFTQRELALYLIEQD